MVQARDPLEEPVTELPKPNHSRSQPCKERVTNSGLPRTTDGNESQEGWSWHINDPKAVITEITLCKNWDKPRLLSVLGREECAHPVI